MRKDIYINKTGDSISATKIDEENFKKINTRAIVNKELSNNKKSWIITITGDRKCTIGDYLIYQSPFVSCMNKKDFELNYKLKKRYEK